MTSVSELVKLLPHYDDIRAAGSIDPDVDSTLRELCALHMYLPQDMHTYSTIHHVLLYMFTHCYDVHTLFACMSPKLQRLVRSIITDETITRQF